MNKRIIGMVVSVALATVGTFALLTYVKGADERAQAGEETVQVLVVEAPIARGTPITEVAGFVTAQWVPVKVRAAGSVTSLTDLSGTVTAVDLVEGEQVVASRFVTPTELVTETVVDIPEGMLEVTVNLDPQRAVGGQPKPGDLVSVVVSFNDVPVEGEETTQLPGALGEEEEQATAEATHIILHKVLVANVQTNGGATAQPADLSTVAHAPAPTDSFLITFALTAPDVERLVFAAEYGSIWLAREPADAPEDGTQILTKDVIFR